ncbi:hypothetical protein ATCM_11505 [Stenotrophomonas sp. ATCM1_4]|nr:hypothetical protein ATCM_11505 [Stenotrophomonas sp. ATCM1_4]
MSSAIEITFIVIYDTTIKRILLPLHDISMTHDLTLLISLNCLISIRDIGIPPCYHTGGKQRTQSHYN